MKTTSIQISTKHRDLLKHYCEKFGFNMSSFVEKIIEEKATPKVTKAGFDGEVKQVPNNTPFGIYDGEADFCKDCAMTMLWGAKRLGWPIVNIELDYRQFYSAFEEAVSMYNSASRRKFEYSTISESGKYWIQRYFLALCKEILGTIRQKFQSIPVPGGEVMLDGIELRTEARLEKELLLQEIRPLGLV